ncbi:MAG: GNAT family N-acetyltransferase, partial [bacterium]|nr:GNAT family N-acetyltransferase [bacterium]
MSDVSIRSLCGSDLAPVLAVWNRALRRDPIDEARFARTILADPDYWPGDDSGFLVATLDDTVVGFCRAIIRRWPNDRLGLEPDDGWIPVIAVDPERHRLGIGSALVSAALDYFRRQRRSRIWVCGTTTSAPGSIVPGVDEDGYPSARPLFEKFQFVADQDAFSMAREIVDFDVHAYGQDAWATGANVAVTSLTPEAVHDLFAFLADALPGSWNIAAR